MSNSKYLDIAVEIIDRIRCGIYSDKLPPVRALAEEFSTAKQTAFRAVQRLSQHGIISGARARGTFIDRSHLPCSGKIALAAFEVKTAAGRRRRAFERLCEQIENDGFTPVPWILPWDRPPFLAQRLLHDDWAGVIFFNSCLTQDICQELEMRRIPFISGNVMPGCPQVNFVETNTFEQMENILQKLLQQGYRRIAMRNISPLEGYNRYCRSRWKKMLGKYGLTVTGYDFFSDSHSIGSNDLSYAWLRRVRNGANPPEVIVSWNHNYAPEIGEFLQLDKTLVLCGVHKNQPCNAPGIVRFTVSGDGFRHELELWKLLQAFMLQKPEKVIHRYLNTLQVDFYDKIPAAADWRT